MIKVTQKLYDPQCNTEKRSGYDHEPTEAVNLPEYRLQEDTPENNEKQKLWQDIHDVPDSIL